MATAGGAPPAPPTLTDGQVTLRSARPDDVPALVDQGRDPQMRRYTRVPLDYGRRDALDFLDAQAEGWRRGTEFGFMIETEGRLAGSVDLRVGEPGAAEVGYALAAWARERSVMSRALRLVLRWGFDVLGLEVVLWKAQVGNWASRRVAWAVGFAVEGTVRGLVQHRGEWKDGWIGSLRCDDPMRPPGPWLDVPLLLDPVDPVDPARGHQGIRLRPHGEDDVDRMVEACADPETQRWLPTLPHPYTHDDAREHLADLLEHEAAGRAVAWAVADAADDRLLAEIAVHLRGFERRQAEIGYWGHPDARGRGVVTAAARIAARHALLPHEDGGLGLDRVVIKAAAANLASQGVATRAGFRPAGTERRADRLRDGRMIDLVRYDLVPEELPHALDRRDTVAGRKSLTRRDAG